MIALKTGTWVLVADSEKALFLENTGDTEFPIFTVRRKDEQDNPPTREQGTSAPGRFNDGPQAQRSAVKETDWHRLEKERFAHDLAETLYAMAHKGRFDRLVIVAGPTLLGELRGALHSEVSDRIVAEIPKTLVGKPISAIEKQVKEDLSEMV